MPNGRRPVPGRGRPHGRGVELWDHANGFQSRACGFVWNALAGQWSRLLMGGEVVDTGRRYDLESGVLCPAGSTLSVCTCLFVAFPTSTIFALLTGYSCHESHVDVSGVKAVGGDYSIDWLETQSGVCRSPGVRSCANSPSPPDASDCSQASARIHLFLGTSA